MDAKILINFSGGVDSTYYLWRWLRENPKSTILVHHCLLFEKRRALEKKATEDVLNWLHGQNLKNFKYVETEFAKKGIKGQLYDLEIVYFMAGLVLKGHRNIGTVLMSRCKEELFSNKGLHQHMKKPGGDLNNFVVPDNRVSIAMQTAQLIARRRVKFISPYQHMPKADMVTELPQQLFDLTWYCRRPRNDKPCGKCFSCQRAAIKRRKVA